MPFMKSKDPDQSVLVAPVKRGIHLIFFLFFHEDIFCGYSLVITTNIFSEK